MQQATLRVLLSSPSLNKEWREVLPKFGAEIGRVLHVNLSMFRDIFEKGGSPSVKLLCQKDAVLPKWIRLPKLQGNMFQKFQKVLYFGLSNQCFSCKKISHLAKDCLAAHVKPIQAIVLSILCCLMKFCRRSFRYIFKLCVERESIDMLSSNPPQIALPECSKDALRQNIGISVSTPSMEIIPLTFPSLCVVDTLLPHEIQSEKVFDTSSNYVWKGKVLTCFPPIPLKLHCPNVVRTL